MHGQEEAAGQGLVQHVRTLLDVPDAMPAVWGTRAGEHAPHVQEGGTEEMKTLRLAEGLTLPTEAVTQKLGWLGTTGSGKTYGASKLAELFWDIKAQFIVLDPVGVWYGLRLAKDGKKPSDIRIPIFGGLHGDVPLEPTSGVLLADLVVDQRISAILDVSQFEHDTDKARFATAFADRFFFRQKASPTAVHLFIEECQEFVPENHQRGEERMKHAFTRMQKIGRNYGIGTSLISQRPQEVSKKALNLAQTLFVFRTTGSHERKAIETWIKDKAIEGQDIGQELPKLKTGAPHVWSPEWLELSEGVAIREKRTFNASATPEVGKAAQARELAHIDLEKIRKDMADSIEKAKAEDPRLLRSQLAKLKAEVQSLNVELERERTKKPVGREKRVEVPVLKDAQITKIERAVQRYEVVAEALARPIGELTAALVAARSAVHEDRLRDRVAESGGSSRPHGRAIVPRQTLPQTRSDARVRGRVDATRATGDITAVQQRILNALAELELLGAREPAREMVAFLAGYTHLNSKGFVNGIGSLRSAGLIDYPAGGAIALTDKGRAAAVYPAAPRSPEEVQERVIGLLGGASARILQPLLEAYPNALPREVVAEKANYQHLNSKGFVNAIGRLRSLGFIDYPDRGTIKAQPVLFLEGV